MRPIPLLLPLLLVTACHGGGGDPLPDADPGPDADLGELGEVLVETWGCCRDAFPEPETHVLIGGVEIVAVDVDGTTTVVSTVEGHATLALHAGASVTAIYRRGTGGEGDVELTTYLGVQPGDTIIFGDYPFPSETVIGMMDVAFPPTAASSVEVVGACGEYFADEETAGYTIHTRGCEPPAEDVFVYAYAPTGFQYAFLDDVAFEDGGSVTVDAWQTAPTFQLSATALPADAEHVSLGLYQIANGRAWFNLAREGQPEAGAFSMTRDWAPVGDGVNADVRFYSPSSSQWIRTRLPVDATSHVFTEADWLPAITDGAFDQDALVGTFTAADDPEVDAVVVGLSWIELDESGEFGYGRSWRVIAPPDLREIQLPRLPDELADLAPQPDDPSYGAGVSLWDFAVDDGYDDTRRRPAWDLGGGFEEDTLFEGGRIGSSPLLFPEA